MTTELFIKAAVASLCWWEAAHCGGIDNMLAVAFVVRNRQRAGWLGGDWLALVYQHQQYAATFFCSPTAAEMGWPESGIAGAPYDLSKFPFPARQYNLGAPDLRNPDFRQLLSRMDEVFSGALADEMTQGALFYCELDRVEREWFRKNILANQSEHPLIAKVGPVSFFR